MTRMTRFAVIIVLVVSTTNAWSQTADASPFPFEQWKTAILAQDAVTLKNFYSTNPAAQVRVNSVMHDTEADTSFWLGLKPRSIDVEVVRNTIRHGHYSFIFRARVLLPNGQALNITDDQSWQQQGDVWRLISVERTDAPSLKQPSNMAKNIYPDDADAHAEIREAEERAARSSKRLLLVFGATGASTVTCSTWHFKVPNWPRWSWQTTKSYILISDRKKRKMRISLRNTRFL